MRAQTRFDISIAIIIAIAIYLTATYVPHLALLSAVAHTEPGALGPVFISLLGSLPTTMGWFGAGVIACAALLTGANSVLIRRRFQLQRPWKRAGAGVGISTLFAGLGSMCAACGFVLFAGATAGTVLGTVLVALPYDGKELGILAVAVLLGTFITLIRSMRTPPTCPIPE
jgi:hypothetical protein